MAVARGNTKIILNKVGEIQNLIGQASACIDTTKQYEIRSLLEEAMKVCIEVRGMYDPT